MAIAGIAFGTITNTMLNNNINNIEVYEQQQATTSNNKQTQTSVQHNAKGHQSNQQVVNLQNTKVGIIYSETVTFNSSKPVDIRAYDDITGQTNTNATVQVLAACI